jgi:hypothetical protein
LNKKTNALHLKDIFYGRGKAVATIVIVLIITISYGLFFYFQGIAESDIKNKLFAQQRDIQLGLTKSLSQHIGSDLDLVMAKLEGLANSKYLQQGDLNSNQTRELMQTNFLEVNSIIDRLITVNENNTVIIDLAPKGEKLFVGANVSHREYVIQPNKTQEPYFSPGFLGLDGNYRIALSYPIINRETGKFFGVVAALIPTIKFFEHYGNIHDINSRFLVVFDRNALLLAVGANIHFVGKNFFGEYIQNFVNHNEILNNLTRNLLAENNGYGIYDYGKGERLTTQYPIRVDGGITPYFLQIVQPTVLIYSQVNETLSKQRFETFTLLAGATAAIAVLIVFLYKWSSILGTEVKRRTMELEDSYQEVKHHLDVVMKEVLKYRGQD